MRDRERLFERAFYGAMGYGAALWHYEASGFVVVVTIIVLAAAWTGMCACEYIRNETEVGRLMDRFEAAVRNSERRDGDA